MFIFYAERLDTTLLMTSEEFIQESNQNKSGKMWGSAASGSMAHALIEKQTKNTSTPKIVISIM